MKKVFNILIAISLVFLLMSCDDSKKETPQGFVYLEDGVFKIDGEQFFPLMLNYKVDVKQLGEDIVILPVSYYGDGETFESHVKLIKELGFNTMRICLDVISPDDANEKLIDGITNMLDIAASYDMKVMLLLKPAFDDKLMAFTSQVMRRFADNPTIFAYDMMNEPLYFDPEPSRDKKDAVKVVSSWRDMVRKNAPNHLFTIGFSEPIEVFEWDPSILPVDFVQIHTYHPLRIPNEIWWYSHYVGKPWMIGETSLPADNDSISYDSQARFVEQVYQYTIDCGGIGFGWWEFHDVQSEYVNFEGNYAGLLNENGDLKPAAYEFKKLCELHPIIPERPINYFNMIGYENYVIKGKIVCGKKPVEGALIRGWNERWRVGMNTYSDENGDFTLYSNDKNVHFEISAPGLTKAKFDNYDLEYHSIDGGECDFSNLPNVDLEYQKISYYPFLKNDTMLFEFKPELFDKVRFVTDMGEIKLEKLK